MFARTATIGIGLSRGRPCGPRVGHARSNPRLILGAAWIVLCAASIAAAVEPAEPQTQPAEPRPQIVLTAQASQLEDQIAGLLQQRGGADPVSDLQIDLRIIARWVLDKSAAAPAQGELAACGFLRAQNLLTAADLLGQQLAGGRALTPTQTEAAGKLHQMTYRLVDLRSVAQLDDSSRQVGNLLLAIQGALPPQRASLPAMRPPVNDSAGQKRVPPALSELSTEAKQAPVSPALRRQLAALAAAASAAAADRNRQDEAATLYQGLVRSMDLARGLQQSGLVDPDARARIDSQLTDGITLFLDVRTRVAGAARIERLARDRDMLELVRKMNLSRQQQEKLTPAVRWAQRHPGRGPELLRIIEQYVALCRRCDALKAPASLTPPQQKAVAELQKQFAARQRDFLSDASSLTESNGFMAITPEQARGRLGQMQRTFEAIELIAGSPAALQALSAYKPRPAGGVERRAGVASSAIAGLAQSPSEGEARRFLQRLAELGKLATEAAGTAAVPPDIDQTYAHGRVADFRNLQRDSVSDLASQAALGKELDETKLDRLRWAQSLIEALRDDAAVEAALKQGPLLARWVDWDADPKEVRRALASDRDATGAAVDGFLSGDSEGLDHWQTIHRAVAPLIELTEQVGPYADVCKALPAGLTGEISKLLTSMDHQPFASERYASFLLGAWNQAESDGRTGDAAGILELLGRRLRNDNPDDREVSRNAD